ncbi:hypothetical protein ACHQM5_020045 [Ranunculus cassubicifolius]
MGYHEDPRKSSRNPQASKALNENKSSIPVDQIIWAHDHPKFARSASKSYGGPYDEVKPTLGGGPVLPRKSVENYQKQSFHRSTKEDELVKHMSNLPRYLQRVERGENIQEKVLNFGVLDWGRLENWKSNKKPAAQNAAMYSPSTSNTSSPFSTVGSSTLSTRSDSGSLAHRKTSPSQDAHSGSSSIAVKSVRASVSAFEDKVPISKHESVEQRKPPVTNFSSRSHQSKTKYEKGIKNDVYPKFMREMGTSSTNSKGCELSFSPKGKTKVSESEYMQKTEGIQQSTPARDKTIVLLLPKNLPKRRFSAPSVSTELTRLNDFKQTETTRSSFSDGFRINEVRFSDIPHSCPQLSTTDTSKQSVINLPRSVNALGSRPQPNASHSVPQSGEMHTVRAEPVQAEENKLTTKEPLSEGRRHHSPNRWPSVGRGRISRSLSFKEGSALPQLNSTYVTTNSGPVETTNNRSRSSPLRRLLDPLLRSKTTNRPTSVEPSHDEGRYSTSSNSIVTDAMGAQQDDKHGGSMVQALLQVTVKNGLPWFTFAVDNNSDILAATMRKTSSSEKYDCSWIYTFYSFQKAKKKSGGWMGSGSKAKNPDYVPNVVGQMKVSGSQQVTMREFVLLDVQPRKPDQETPNLVSKVELAAIVIKVPTDSVENVKSGSILENQSHSSIVVVLPSDVHGLSASGTPSPLLDRWKSGGSCDCGGWDLGCQLRFLSNQDQHTKSDSSELLCAQDMFDLFPQGGRSQKGIPSFSFTTCNKGVHSIDFNQSMSSLQAFSICIAFLHCKNLAKVSNLFQGINVKEPESERMKLYSEFEEQAPSRSATFPPPSPVGRV